MSSDLARPLVLVVEDDRDTRDMYALFLESQGLAVITASDVSSAFEEAVARQPGVVITDLLLPGPSSGADLCRRLHEDPRTTHIPALLLTGSSRESELRSAVEGGCAEVRIKPHLPDALLTDVRRLLARNEAQGMKNR